MATFTFFVTVTMAVLLGDLVFLLMVMFWVDRW